MTKTPFLSLLYLSTLILGIVSCEGGGDNFRSLQGQTDSTENLEGFNLEGIVDNLKPNQSISPGKKWCDNTSNPTNCVFIENEQLVLEYGGNKKKYSLPKDLGASNGLVTLRHDSASLQSVLKICKSDNCKEIFNGKDISGQSLWLFKKQFKPVKNKDKFQLFGQLDWATESGRDNRSETFDLEPFLVNAGFQENSSEPSIDFDELKEKIKPLATWYNNATEAEKAAARNLGEDGDKRVYRLVHATPLVHSDFKDLVDLAVRLNTFGFFATQKGGSAWKDVKDFFGSNVSYDINCLNQNDNLVACSGSTFHSGNVPGSQSTDYVTFVTKWRFDDSGHQYPDMQELYLAPITKYDDKKYFLNECGLDISGFLAKSEDPELKCQWEGKSEAYVAKQVASEELSNGQKMLLHFDQAAEFVAEAAVFAVLFEVVGPSASIEVLSRWFIRGGMEESAAKSAARRYVAQLKNAAGRVFTAQLGMHIAEQTVKFGLCSNSDCRVTVAEDLVLNLALIGFFKWVEAGKNPNQFTPDQKSLLATWEKTRPLLKEKNPGLTEEVDEQLGRDEDDNSVFSDISDLSSLADSIDSFADYEITSPATGGTSEHVRILAEEHEIQYLKDVGISIPVTEINLKTISANDPKAGIRARNAWRSLPNSENATTYSVTIRQRNGFEGDVFDVALWPTSPENSDIAPFINRNGGHVQLAKFIFEAGGLNKWEGTWFGGAVTFDATGKVVELSTSSTLQEQDVGTGKELEGDALKTFINVVRYAIGN